MSLKSDTLRSAVYLQEATTGWRWLITGVLFTLVFIMAARSPVDSDLWWHLRAGQETWQSAKPLLVDTFSHTRAGTTWINHSWLSQVGFYLFYAAGGYLALSALVASLAVASLVLVYAQMEAPPFLRAFVIVLAAAVAAPVWSPRPQLVSLALFALLAYLLYLYKWKQINHLWLIIPIFILWSNLHGGYVLGLLLIACLAAGEVLNRLLGREGDEIFAWRAIAQLGVWLVAGGLAAAINPNGIAMWAIPFKTVGVGVVQDLIAEWGSPDFHQFIQQPLLWMLFLTFAATGLSNRRLDGSDLITITGFAYLAFLARRNFGPFALVAAPVLARHMHALLLEHEARWQTWFRRRIPLRTSQPSVHGTVNLLLVGLLIGVAVMKIYVVSRPELVEKYNRAIFPVQAATWIETNQPVGRLFNEYNWGGYLDWKLPDTPVFVDGRTDLYDDALLADYLHTIAGDANWQETLDRYCIGMVLVGKNAGLERALHESEEWSLGYADELAVVYVRDR